MVQSTIFTGIYGYAIAVIWLLCGLGYGLFLVASTYCCKRNKRKLKKRSTCCYHKHDCYLWIIVSAIFLTVLAMWVSYFTNLFASKFKKTCAYNHLIWIRAGFRMDSISLIKSFANLSYLNSLYCRTYIDTICVFSVDIIRKSNNCFKYSIRKYCL